MARNTVLGKFLVTKKEVQYAKLKDAFAVLDTHNTGFINSEDVGNVLRSIGYKPTDDQVKHVIDVLDVDKNGVVQFYNFFNFLASRLKDASLEEDLKSTFRHLDKDQDDFISAADFRAASASRGGALTDEHANFLVETADLDRDGKLSYKEFRRIMMVVARISQDKISAVDNTVLGKYLVNRREEQCPKLKEAFAPFDKDNTGFIKCDDLRNVMRSIGENPTDDELKDAIDGLDVYKIGLVQFSDFLNFMAPLLGDDPEEYLKFAFNLFDINGDGYISAEELCEVTANRPRAVTVEEAKFIVKTSDFDDDGKLSYEDYKKFMLRKCDDST